MGEPRILKAAIKDIKCGERVTIIEPSNVYGCELSDDVFVGPFVEIQRGVKIGQRTRVQSHTFVCEGVEIGSDCFIAHGVMFVNDLFKAGAPSRDPKDWKGTLIGSKVSIGSGATILPVKICDGTVIGAGAVVTKDITKPGIYAGNPATFRRVVSDT
jgi:acetyltransferase-like isoleucine patch superfamily enzyme